MRDGVNKPTDDAAAALLGGLDKHVGFMLRLAQVAVFRGLLSALKPLDLRVTDFSVLLVIGATPGLKQQEIGRALHIQRPNLVTIIDQLEGRGLVHRGAVPGDRRAYALSLTEDGAAVLAKAKSAHERHNRKIVAALGDLDEAQMLAALERIAAT